MTEKILLVDDDQELCALTARRLSKQNYTPFTAYSGAEAIALIKENDFRVVVTDVNMPGMDGIALTRQIVERRPGMLVIIMTSHNNVETAGSHSGCPV